MIQERNHRSLQENQRHVCAYVMPAFAKPTARMFRVVLAEGWPASRSPPPNANLVLSYTAACETALASENKGEGWPASRSSPRMHGASSAQLKMTDTDLAF